MVLFFGLCHPTSSNLRLKQKRCVIKTRPLFRTRLLTAYCIVYLISCFDQSLEHVAMLIKHL